MTMTCIVLIAEQGWCVMPNTWNYRIPVVAERKPTADELYLQALREKHECLVAYRQRNVTSQTLFECTRDFNEAIEHYKKLAWREER